MILGVPIGELLLLAGLILVGGLVTGILAGLFGIGGGALIVPVLYEIFGAMGVTDDVRFQLCVGTSMAIIVPTNVLSFLTHRGKGAVMMAAPCGVACPADSRHDVSSRPSHRLGRGLRSVSVSPSCCARSCCAA